MSLDLITNPNNLKKIRARQKLEDDVKITRLKRKRFLKDQILNHDRIDLLMTEVLDYNKTQDFHLAMWYHREHNCRKKDKQRWHLALAPRGGGKSTILTISDCILRVLKDSNVRILIASKTDDNARGFLSEVKQKLKSQKLIDIFGPQVGDVWNEGEINVASRKAAWKEKTIETVGYTGTLASKHFDYIYGDDLVDEENSKTEVQRKKLLTWFYKILDPTLMADGRMYLASTRYHPEDLNGHLIDTVFTKKNKAGKVLKKYYVNILCQR